MEKKRIIRAGALFIASIAVMIWGYSYLKNNNLFTSDQIFYGVYNDVNGLSAGNAVYINGYKIGMVKDVGLNENKLDEIIVEFSVEKNIQLPQTTIAEIADLDIMGTKGIRLLVPSDTNELFVSGDTMQTSLEEDLKEQVNQQILPIKAKAEDLMGSFDSVLVTVKTLFNDETRQNLTKSFAHIKTTLQTLEHTTYTFDTLMTTQRSKMSAIISNAASISENIKNNNEHIAAIIQNFSAISDSVAKADLAETIRNADKALSQFGGIVKKINSGTGSAGQLIYNDTLYTNLEQASKDLDLLVKDLKENPKRYVRFSVFDIGGGKKDTSSHKK